VRAIAAQGTDAGVLAQADQVGSTWRAMLESHSVEPTNGDVIEALLVGITLMHAHMMSRKAEGRLSEDAFRVWHEVMASANRP
jgi:hypothetical protein